MAIDTRARILATSTELFGRYGFGVGLKRIVEQAGAPFGSLYHHFPGGKDELGEAVIRGSADYYRELAMSGFDPDADLATAIRGAFAIAAERLAASDYADACPVATVALEVASSNERLRAACRDVFDGWLADAAGLFAVYGLDEPSAALLAVQFMTAIEGGFILARVQRSTAPLITAGEGLAQLAAILASPR